ncbi:MAG: DUF4954 family protein [Termitinemataceae bacterium]|nr:MAG: DUF4954 family protein [Termitinemataceae bacterium]
MGASLVTSKNYGYGFIEGAFCPAGKDEYYLRNEQLQQCGINIADFRNLTSNEKKALKKNNNECYNWDDFLTSGNFDTSLIKNNFFAGLVRLCGMSATFLKYHDYCMPVGITNSRIIACDIGKNAAIHNCHYMSHYIVGNECILSNINELDTSNHSKFGEGFLKDGESEDVRVWIDPRNESGGRSVLAFNGMNCADAYMWTTWRSDKKLIDCFKAITQNNADSRRGYYGTIGNNSVIKHCNTIKDAKIGECAYIKGANKLKNITINSDKNEPTQIGEGTELVNGIIGFGCRIFYEAKAVRFVLGNNCALKYGARLIHSILGDNSTISCCEVLNNLVFPAHEQHHNNSFLIASLIKGQSNMAAGATVGSNHNSRGNDGEIIAGRGFWPGLSSALKHNSSFASYVLIAKGNYPFELNIPFPFSLCTNNSMGTGRIIMPAYWWMYNIYALERNAWKFRARDERTYIGQHYETDYLAPDTAAEIINAIKLLQSYTTDENGCVTIPCRTFERSNEDFTIVKVKEAISAYKDMLLYYAVKTLCTHLLQIDSCHSQECPNNTQRKSFFDFQNAAASGISLEWENLGGQLVPTAKVTALKESIKSGVLKSWADIHKEYDRFFQEYQSDKAHNALQVLRYLNMNHTTAAGEHQSNIDEIAWQSFLKESLRVRNYIEDQVYKTKQKDYADPFRNVTYSSLAERDSVLGSIEDNKFIMQSRQDTKAFYKLVENV